MTRNRSYVWLSGCYSSCCLLLGRIACIAYTHPIAADVAHLGCCLYVYVWVGHTGEHAKTDEPIDRYVVLEEDSCAPNYNHVSDGVHIVASWRIRLNDPRRRCGPVSHYFDHLVMMETVKLMSGSSTTVSLQTTGESVTVRGFTPSRDVSTWAAVKRRAGGVVGVGGASCKQGLR